MKQTTPFATVHETQALQRGINAQQIEIDQLQTDIRELREFLENHEHKLFSGKAVHKKTYI